MNTDASDSTKKEAKAQAAGISFWGWPAWTALLVFVLDQTTKIAVDHWWAIGYARRVIPGFFNLVHYRNTGAAWGMFSRHTWILGLISLAAFIAFIWLFRSQNRGNKWTALMMAMLIGGVAGNMVDRIFRKSVIDFLDFYIGSSHWPAFNVADSAICVSIAALLLLSFVGDKGDKGDKGEKQVKRGS